MRLIDLSPGDACTLQERLFFIGRANQAGDMENVRWIVIQLTRAIVTNLDQIGWLELFAENFYAIAARLSRNRGLVIMHLEQRSRQIDGPRSLRNRGHQISPPTGSNSPKIAQKLSFKNQCTPLILFNS